MCTTRLETVCASSFSERHQISPLEGRSLNEQVWTGLQWWPPDVSGRAWVCPLRGRVCQKGSDRYVQGTMWPIPWCTWCYLSLTVDRQTPVKTLPSRNFVFAGCNKICGSARMTYGTSYSLQSFFNFWKMCLEIIFETIVGRNKAPGEITSVWNQTLTKEYKGENLCY